MNPAHVPDLYREHLVDACRTAQHAADAAKAALAAFDNAAWSDERSERDAARSLARYWVRVHAPEPADAPTDAL